MNIREIMTPGTDLTGPDSPVREVAKRMRDDDVGALPVGENDRLVGMVTDRDIAIRGFTGAREPSECTVRDVMSEGIYYCFEQDDAERAAEIMAQHKVRRLPVLNGEKRLVGVVGLTDLVRVGGLAEKALSGVSISTAEPRL